ncbi:SpoIID/LytB domain-containing protein [Paenibacillus roseipurpureus]|uniref:SpoIID/LytB domain-containing protein n=1 Tax=Paenibacillus roseopurpureus TaxID=2918901 RepID=A0AA96LQ11_9BACL|nr:SpoIID/LytB domain-containing protein [Paenibacillus sp. MBLB1832]WNR45870.1 SpoIID/LytB domain-containing protein [Paenibacillus sp. MBLB1832]
MSGRTILLHPKRLAVVVSAVLAIGASTSVWSQQAHAVGTKHLDSIRVALLINASTYKKIEPLVSLSSPGGFDVAVRSTASSEAKPWTSLADTNIRMSLDQYSVMMLETSDFAAAKALYTKLNGMAEESYVLSRNRSGKTVYQVYYGNLPTKAEADSAAAAAIKDATVATLTKSSVPVINGPLHWSAGVYATEAAAQQQAAVYAQAGLNADLVLQADQAGKLSYYVWVGSESTDVKLAAVKDAALKAAPNIPLQPANIASPYLIRRSDVSTAAAPTAAVTHYAAGTGEQRTIFKPKQQTIAVKEKLDRSYRGAMEISAFHDRLALVNEIPMEQYLYGVVGAELNAQWPLEALKAQAVAARTYAIYQGNKYEIANVTDTTLDQAYYGVEKEFATGIQAVDATQDEVISDKRGNLISPVFASNAGGQTADPIEVWGNAVDYLRSVASPDQGAEQGKAIWYQIQLTDGRTGFVHSMYLKDTGQKDKSGKAIFESTEQDVNVRLAPYVDNTANPAIAKLALKEKVTVQGQEKESNAYSWIRGPYTLSDIKSKLTAAKITINGELTSLEITKRGPSGRVIEMKANGVVVNVKNPDALRTALGGLPSTLFEIEGAGSYTGTSSNAPTLAMLSKNGIVSSAATSDSVYVLSGKQMQPTAVKIADLMTIRSTGISKPSKSVGPTNGSSTIQGNPIMFRGKGFGHGLGMSQWGAKGFAEQGYDYKKILQTYYAGVTITKE